MAPVFEADGLVGAFAFKDAPISRDMTVEGDHGRTVTAFHDIGRLQVADRQPALGSVVMVESQRETNGRIEAETRFLHRLAHPSRANALGPMIRITG